MLNQTASLKTTLWSIHQMHEEYSQQIYTRLDTHTHTPLHPHTRKYIRIHAGTHAYMQALTIQYNIRFMKETPADTATTELHTHTHTHKHAHRYTQTHTLVSMH